MFFNGFLYLFAISSKTEKMNLAEGIGFTAAVFTTVAFLPQVIRAWKTRSTHDLSFGTIIIFIVGVSLWLVYGLMIQDRPVMYANTFTLALILVLFYLKLKFR